MLTIDLPKLVTEFIPLLTVVALLMASIWVINRLLNRGTTLGKEAEFRRQSFVLVVSIIGLAALIVSLPIASDNRSQLLTLYGLVLTAIITISSTTLASNMMAGLMLRSVKNFRLGDFIRVGEHFGRVTERDLFHTEIQTEDRDLITLPNMYLVTQPVRVIRADGTIVSCEVSLGYDDAPATIEPLLIAAAEKCELQEPFVQIQELGRLFHRLPRRRFPGKNPQTGQSTRHAQASCGRYSAPVQYRSYVAELYEPAPGGG